MWYAIITPGISKITEVSSDVERIKLLYPYPKIFAHREQKVVEQWFEQNQYKQPIPFLRNYGNTLKKFTIHASYKIGENALFIKYDLKSVGNLFIEEQDDDNILIEYSGNIIRVRLDNVRLSNTTIDGHMSAIYTLLKLIGNVVDIDIKIQYYSIYYALTLYSKSNRRLINLTRDLIRTRHGGTAFTYGDD